jgi:glycosyltransferase involved in cell wall biosynthesis
MVGSEDKPLVSVIIPAYNAGRYIKEAVDSALAQTYKNCEVVVVDDGSTDNTRQVLAPYIDAGKIKYIYQENKGLAGARNTGIKNSSGEYITLLDADDIFLPRKIERQVNFLEKHPECDICYCDLYHFYEDKPDQLLKLNYRYYSGKEVLPHLIAGNFIAPISVVARRTVFERFGYFDETLKRSEDIEFWLRIALGGGQICFLPEVLGKLRIRRSGNLQDEASQLLVRQSHVEVLERVKQKVSAETAEKLRIDYYLSLYKLRVVVAYLLRGQRQSARLLIAEALKLYPPHRLLGFSLYLLSFLPIFFSRAIFILYLWVKRRISLRPVILRQ